MDVQRKGNTITIVFDEQEAVGLYAILTQNHQGVAPMLLEKGNFMYAWFFSQVQKLATSFETEKTVYTQSPETMQLPASLQTPTNTKPGKKR